MTTAALEFIKWLALVLMTGDHIDAAFFNRTAEPLTALGRMVMPMFAAVFGYNLARPQMTPEKLRAVTVRLLIVGCIAYPFYGVVLGQGWLTLNIMFAFAVAAQCALWLDVKPAGWQGRILLLIVISGLCLEFMWAAPILTLAWRWYWKAENNPDRPSSIWPLYAVLASMGLLCVINQNLWALGALVVIWSAEEVADGWKLRRHRNAFLVYYPAHLAVLALLVAQLR